MFVVMSMICHTIGTYLPNIFKISLLEMKSGYLNILEYNKQHPRCTTK